MTINLYNIAGRHKRVVISSLYICRVLSDDNIYTTQQQTVSSKCYRIVRDKHRRQASVYEHVNDPSVGEPAEGSFTISVYGTFKIHTHLVCIVRALSARFLSLSLGREGKKTGLHFLTRL